MKIRKPIAFLLAVFSTITCSERIAAEEVVLVGWNQFDGGSQLHRYANSAKTAVGEFRDITGIMYGGHGSRNTWGSTDGTYGSSKPVGSTATNGSMSLRISGNNLNFRITNGSKRNLYLSRIVFDFASVNGNSPRNLKLYYQNGSLSDPNGKLLQSWQSILNGLNLISDYEDVEVDLSNVLNDQVLAPGQTALFRFVADTANNNFQAMSIDNIAILGAFNDFATLTYNIHGGKGPGGEGNVQSNLTAFRDNLMQNEDVLCFQEVDFQNGEWDIIKNVFSDYPYTYQTINTTTAFVWPWQSRKRTSIAILSKHPFTSTNSKLIQIDPAVDRWERHAQHVTINYGGETVNIFNFHNTFNFNNNDFQYEKSGLEKFRTYVYDRLNITSVNQGGDLMLLGDFNLFAANVTSILPATTRLSNGRDHIVSPLPRVHNGVYSTISAKLSDHNAVWGTFNIAPVSNTSGF